MSTLIDDLTAIRDCLNGDMETRFRRLCDALLADARTRIPDVAALTQALDREVRNHFHSEALTIDRVSVEDIDDVEQVIRVLVVFTTPSQRLDPVLSTSVVRHVRHFMRGPFADYFPVFSFRSSHEDGDA